MVEPLAKANAELGEMRKHMVSYNRDKQFLASAKARLKVQDGKLEQYSAA